MNTPHFKFRLPPYLKEEIKKRTDNVSGWIKEAIQEKLERTQ